MLPATPHDVRPIVEIRDVRKSFGRVEVLRGVTLIVQPGEVVVVVGRSGSGKSTLLRCVDHLETIDSGRIIVDGQPMGPHGVGDRLSRRSQSQLTRQRRQLGMVFQHFNLFPHMTALENIVAAPVAVRGLAAERARTEALRLLARVGLQEKQDCYPAQLSGGQQQRVAIARALAMEPKILLLDEPTSALDPAMTREVTEVMTSLAAQGMTMIVVSHEMSFARAAADRIILMHEGRVVEDAPPEAFFRGPRTELTHDFLD